MKKRDRGWRKQQNERIIKKRKKLLKHIDKYRIEFFEEQENRLAVKHPCDCGKPDCGVCSGHKKNKACGSKWKDEHGLLEEVIKEEVKEELKED